MALSKSQQQIVLIALVSLIVLINGYYYLTGEKPKTAPLTYTRGAIAVAPVRQGPSSRMVGNDPLNVFLERRREKFPNVVREIFQMENPVPKPKATVVEKTPEETPPSCRGVAQAARADLMKFQMVGYLTEAESTIFLTKEGELFIVKKGSKLLKSYKVKETGKNFVILLDTVTGVEVQRDLAGGETSPQTAPQMAPQVMPNIPRRQLGPPVAPGPAPAPGQ
jgi:hypothetical protein